MGFETSGDPLPAEASFNYAARRKRDRFIAENLHALLAGLGIDRPIPTVFAATDEFFLIDERLQHAEWAAQVEARACTPAQADDPSSTSNVGSVGRRTCARMPPASCST